ncbi:MAG: DEAD/DEAH box helicase, partial [Phycisphaeraceae bacterium]
MDPITHWMRQTRGCRPFDYQLATWAAYLAGESGLVHAPTGMGKTFAVWLGPLRRWCDRHPDREAWAEMAPPPLKVLWITPLRALAADTAEALREPVEALGLPWTLERRTGDVSSSVKARQRKRLPSALVTTPESLSLLLSYADAKPKFRHLECVIVDEWHELMSTKRGTQTELGLARLRRWNPDLQTWGLSATMGNLDEARDVLLGTPGRAAKGRLICGAEPKEVAVETLAPESVERFPWAGHLGLRLLPGVIAELEAARSALVFTNTRSQAELWFAALLKARPDWIGAVALHHGSLDRRVREEVERLLRQGRLKCVVCTSSLDLGVDFSPVDRVFQVGSPKGVPAHACELVELAAARAAVEERAIEARRPLERPLDVLVQHLVTLAMGGGFDEQRTLAEVRSTYAYRHLSDQEWQWAMDFVTRGGEALRAYPQYARVRTDEAGRWVVSSQQIARLHRMAIGTITSDVSITVKLKRGKRLGTVEESFIARLKPGDRFVFAGQVLELIKVRQMVAEVRR